MPANIHTHRWLPPFLPTPPAGDLLTPARAMAPANIWCAIPSGDHAIPFILGHFLSLFLVYNTYVCIYSDNKHLFLLFYLYLRIQSTFSLLTGEKDVVIWRASPKSWESKPNAAEARARENSQTGTRIVRDTRNDLKRGHGITGLTDRLDNKPKKI